MQLINNTERKAIMKKRLFALALTACMTISLAACGDSGKDTKKTSGDLTLGQYKGLEVSKSTADITDEELTAAVERVLKSNQKDEYIEEGTTQKDNKITAVYTATIDGESVSALSSASSGSTVTLSDGSFAIEGFIDKLIEQQVGSKVEFDITIPEDTENSVLKTYAGKTVHYVVEIKNIVNTIVPELTDEWVKEKYGYMNISTIDGFKEYLKRQMYLSYVYDEVKNTLLDNSTVNSYDSDLLSKYTDIAVTQFESTISSYYGITLDAYLQAMDKTEDEFRKEKEEEAKPDLKERMVIEKIAETENITLSDEEFNTRMEQYAVEYGLENVDKLKEYYDGVWDDSDWKYSILAEKVQEIICDNVVEVEDKEENTTADGETTASE